MLSEVTTTLIDAREHIVAGWCKGAFYRDDGKVCALGAFLVDPKQHWLDKRKFFYGENFESEEDNIIPLYKSVPKVKAAIEFLYRAIKEIIPDRKFYCENTERQETSAISEYNNLSTTSHEDIIGAFDKAIAKSMNKA